MICMFKEIEKSKSDHDCLDCKMQFYQNCEIMKKQLVGKNQVLKIEKIGSELIKDKIDDYAKEINNLRMTIYKAVFRIGEILDKLQKILEFNEFKYFLDKIKFSEKTAGNYIKIYNYFPKDIQKNLNGFNIEKLKVLIQINEKDKLIEYIEEDEDFEVKEIRQLRGVKSLKITKKKIREMTVYELEKLKNILNAKKFDKIIELDDNQKKELFAKKKINIEFTADFYFQFAINNFKRFLESCEDEKHCMKLLDKEEIFFKPIINDLYKYYSLKKTKE